MEDRQQQQDALRLAARCLKHGHGAWSATTPNEPYLLETRRYMPHFNLSGNWWGKGDDDVRQSTWAGLPRRPPRAELGYEWTPTGTGCESLQAASWSSRKALVGEFCKRWRGRSLLFVGDSTSATSFTSLAHIVGFVNTTYSTTNPCWRRKYAFGPIGRGAQEIDLKVQLCAPWPGGVHATFLRNEDLNAAGWRDSNGQPLITSAPRGAPKFLCDWGQAAEMADFAVINTGLHHHGSLAAYLGKVNSTFARLTSMYARTGRDVAHHMLYRSSWAAVAGCNNMSDPLDPAQAAALDGRHSPADHYNWSSLSPQNEGVRSLAAASGVPFWNVYSATLMRPGGHRPGNDCVHYWLPGPPDDLTLQLMAYLNHVAPLM